jgi:hypothetical protein
MKERTRAAQYEARGHGAGKVRWQDRFIADCSSWADFWARSTRLPDGKTGALFERLTQLYLQTAPEYQTELRYVWTLREVPPDIRRSLNLPGPDEGIDLIGRTRRGEYWAIQSKFRRQRDKPLNRRELGTLRAWPSILATPSH